MSDSKLTIKSFTVSCGLDVFRNGEKHGSFVNMTVEADPPMSMEDFGLARIDASFSVAKAVLLDALTRGALSEADAIARINALVANTKEFKDSLLKKKAAPQPPPDG